MPRVKIQLADNIKRVVIVDTEATKGATLGTDVYLPSGALGSPTTVREWLGLGTAGTSDIRNGYGILISGSGPKTVSVNRAAAFTWQGQHNWELPLWGPDGTAPLPAFTFTSDPNTGLYSVGADNLGISTGGTLRWDINSTRSLHAVPIYLPNGAVGAPALTFGTDTDLGLYRVGTDNLGTAVAGVLRWDISATRVLQTDTPLEISRAVAVSGTFYDAVKFWRSETNRNGGFTLQFQDGTPIGDDLQVRMGFWNVGDVTAAVPPTGAKGFVFDTIGHGTASASDFVFRRYSAAATSASLFEADSDTSQLRFASGSLATPSLSFISSTGSGFSWNSGNSSVSLSVAGTNTWAFQTGTSITSVPIRGAGGAANAPTFSFSGDTDTGIYNSTTDTLNLVAGGSTRFVINTASSSSTLPFRGPDGSAGAPSYSFTNDNDNGIYYIGTNNWGFSAGGTLRWDINTTRIVTTVPRQGADGSNTAPAYSFSADTDNGMYRITTDSYGFSVGGTLAFTLGLSAQPRAAQFSAGFLRSSTISPAQLTANTDNWNPTGLSTACVIRLSTDASRDITGITALGGGTELLLCNTGAQNAVLKHDVTSTAANRFFCPGSADYTLTPNSSVWIWYDSTSSRWRVI